MSLFARPPYISEITQFIAKLKANKPTLEAEQRAGRALLWDHEVDAALEKDYRAAQVAQQPYVYQTST